MKRITVELSDDIVADIERSAADDRRSVDNWLDVYLRRHFYGAVAFMPDGWRNTSITLRKRPRITTRIRARVYRDSGGKCAYCKAKIDPFLGWDVDHVVPVTKGGTNDPANLCAACEGCNARKGGMDADEFKASLIGA